MKVKRDEPHAVGVIVGRFQVPELHEAHKELIRFVCDEHDKVLIFLGLSPLMVTRENPLDFEARKQMILQEFPDVNVLYVKDQASDEVWSKMLDERIEDVTTPSQTVMLYGGRDSFVERYHGKHATAVLESDRVFSGTVIRKEVSRKSVKASPDFRAGVVWASHSTFPTAYPTVDIGIFNEDGSKILLVRKPNEKLWRLPGGFADPNSESFEADARREALEETGVTITDPEYVGSFKIDDWRYRNEQDKIKTLLFRAKYLSGHIQAADDVEEARWYPVDRLRTKAGLHETSRNHQGLIKALIIDRKEK